MRKLSEPFKFFIDIRRKTRNTVSKIDVSKEKICTVLKSFHRGLETQPGPSWDWPVCVVIHDKPWPSLHLENHDEPKVSFPERASSRP